MAVNVFGLDYTDIELMLQGYPLLDVQSEVETLIEQESSILAAHLRQKGLLDAATTANADLYNICKRYVSLRVGAEVGRIFTHQDPDLSISRDRRANEILEMIRRMPESMPEKFDRDEHAGSTRYLTRRKLGRRSRRPRSSDYFGD